MLSQGSLKKNKTTKRGFTTWICFFALFGKILSEKISQKQQKQQPSDLDVSGFLGIRTRETKRGWKLSQWPGRSFDQCEHLQAKKTQQRKSVPQKPLQSGIFLRRTCHWIWKKSRSTPLWELKILVIICAVVFFPGLSHPRSQELISAVPMTILFQTDGRSSATMFRLLFSDSVIISEPNHLKCIIWLTPWNHEY